MSSVLPPVSLLWRAQGSTVFPDPSHLTCSKNLQDSLLKKPLKPCFASKLYWHKDFFWSITLCEEGSSAWLDVWECLWYPTSTSVSSRIHLLRILSWAKALGKVDTEVVDKEKFWWEYMDETHKNMIERTTDSNRLNFSFFVVVLLFWGLAIRGIVVFYCKK